MATGGKTTWIDRRKCTRDRPMRCLVLGPSRTGTDSMRAAMRILGLDDCYHGYSVVADNPPDSYMWIEAMDAKFEGKGKPFERKDWDQLLGHCQAVADIPCILFSEELIAVYPEAKVVLTHPPKGFDAWYQSSCNTILPRRESWRRWFQSWVNHEANITGQAIFRSFDYFWRRDFRANARSIIDEHSDKIRRLVPADRLLEYSVTEGWEPLCSFLQLPIPETPFPAKNDPLQFFSTLLAIDRRREMEAMRTTATIAAALAVTCYGLWQFTPPHTILSVFG